MCRRLGVRQFPPRKSAASLARLEPVAVAFGCKLSSLALSPFERKMIQRLNALEKYFTKQSTIELLHKACTTLDKSHLSSPIPHDLPQVTQDVQSSALSDAAPAPGHTPTGGQGRPQPPAQPSEQKL